ncbi:hypothetical protein AB0940_29625 [Streptomyces sp. NPDC006656]
MADSAPWNLSSCRRAGCSLAAHYQVSTRTAERLITKARPHI